VRATSAAPLDLNRRTDHDDEPTAPGAPASTPGRFGRRAGVRVGVRARADRLLMLVGGLVSDGGRRERAGRGKRRLPSRRHAWASTRWTRRTVGLPSMSTSRPRATGPPSSSCNAATMPPRVHVTVSAADVTVTVSKVIPTGLLQLALIKSFTVNGEATATATSGIDDEINRTRTMTSEPAEPPGSPGDRAGPLPARRPLKTVRPRIAASLGRCNAAHHSHRGCRLRCCG